MRAFQAITCAMTLFATWHFSVECYRIVHASLHFESLTERSAWLAADQTVGIENMPYLLQTLTGDGILLYRCYLLWQDQKWIVVLPSLTWLATSGIGFTNLVREFEMIDPGFTDETSRKLTSAFYICSVITVVVTTSIILLKVYLSRRYLQMGWPSVFFFTPSLAIFLESGAIYCSLLMVLTALFLARCTSGITFFDLLVPVTPILFCSVLLALGESKGTLTDSSVHNTSSSTWSRRTRSRSSAPDHSVRSGVHIQREIELYGITHGVPDPGKDLELSQTSHSEQDGHSAV